MNQSSQPTLEDVAKAVGVSTATISRALNEPGKVAKKTLEKIDSVIETLGYTPNFGGKVLASNRTNTVGAIIPSLSNAMFANGIQAFQDALSKSNVNCLIANTHYDPEEELRQIRSLVAHGADGLMLIGADHPQKTKDFLAKRNIPHILSWCLPSSKELPFVGFDNRKAAYDATQKVLTKGHRKIGLISGDTSGNDRAHARKQGVVAAIQDFGQDARIVSATEARYFLDDGRDAFSRIWQSDEKPTALICGNDVLAAGAILQARELGLSLPEQLSVIGFDDIGLARVVSPALTTVHVPQEEMGRAAAKLLLDKIAGKTNLQSVTLETRFVERDSLTAI